MQIAGLIGMSATRSIHNSSTEGITFWRSWTNITFLSHWCALYL